MRIAIQHDFVVQPNGEKQSFSDRWKELARMCDIAIQEVDVFESDVLRKIGNCDGFMWRYGFSPLDLSFAKRLLPAVEHGLRLPIFPSWQTSWHFEDKISQHYLLSFAGIPTPRTWVFWKEGDALDFCRSATYPFVAKLAAGIRSSNVMLVHGRAQAERLTRQLFGEGIHTFQPVAMSLRTRIGRSRLVRKLRGRPVASKPRQSGYLYVQEFLPGNDFDTRVTVIGDRAFAFRRFNREGDFRASGSGRISWDPAEIDPATVQLAFDVAQKLGTQSVAIDGMRRGESRLVGEISYTYAAWAIAKCPGHWIRSTGSGEMRWVDGALRAEDAIFEDFVRLVGARQL